MDNFTDLRNLGDSYAANGYFAEAIEHYEKAVEALPRSRHSQEQQALLTVLMRSRINRAKNNLKA